QFAVTGSGLEQDARRVANDSRHLARFVTTGAKLVNSFVVVKRIHGTLATHEQYRIEVFHIYTRQRPRVLNELHVLRRRNESETEQVMRGIAALVPGVAPFIPFEFAAFRAANLDRVTMFHEFQYGCTNSLHQKPIGHDVSWEIEGFEATMVTRF